VQGVDCSKERIKAIEDGCKTTHEPELLSYLKAVIGTPYFSVSTQCKEADYFIIAVPTPFTHDKRANMSHVSSAAMQIAQVLKKGDTVILESTVPVGATLSLAQVLAHESGLEKGKDFFVAYCPERVLPGNIFQELKVNDRVIGGIDQGSMQRAAEFYKYFVGGDFYLTNAATAEIVKLIENSYRDVNIAFAHQVAGIAQQEGLNPYEVIELANKHPRVSILQPTCGVGGHCVAVDPWFLVESFPEHSALLRTARVVNQQRTDAVLQSILKTIRTLQELTKKPLTVAVLGLSYKPNIDDLRESPALAIAQQLVECPDITILVCDPHVKNEQLSAKVSAAMVSIEDALTSFRAPVRAHTGFSKVLDFCGLLHSPRQESVEQEQFYWPASESKTHYTINTAHAINDRSILPGEHQ
jgi:UDP-N-acetyl-D-mannosaminuronic acid dehydrogenase